MFPKSHIACTNQTYQKHTFARFLSDMQALEFAKLELWGGAPHFYPEHMTPQQIEAIRRDIEAHGLACALYAPAQGHPWNIAAEEEDLRQASLRYFGNALRIARDIGAPAMPLLSGSGYFDRSMDAAWAWSLEGLWQLAEFGKKCGVRVLLEPAAPIETNLVTNLPRLSKMLSDVGHKNLGAVADINAMALADESLTDYREEIGDKLLHIHFADGHPGGYLPWGAGALPLGIYMDELLSIEYQGLLTLQIGSAPDPRAAYVQSLEALAPYTRVDA